MKLRQLRPTMIFGALSIMALTLVVSNAMSAALGWNDKEVTQIRDLWIGSLGEMPNDATNPVAEDPKAVEFGYKLFFDKRLSSNGGVSCANCHNPEYAFTDGEQLAEGVGQAGRNTPTIIGAAYQDAWFWDGRSDSMWSQALGPLENPNEHGGNRMQYVKTIAEHYKDEYEALFGKLPDFSDGSRFPDNAMPGGAGQLDSAWQNMSVVDRNETNQVFVNMGRAIAAYERRIVPGPSRFDTYAKGLVTQSMDDQTLQTLMSSDEIEGLRLFVGKAGCVGCHSGSLVSDGKYHNTGVPPNPKNMSDMGRFQGFKDWASSEFNCLSSFGNAESTDCKERRYQFTEFLQTFSSEYTSNLSTMPMMREYKTPTLRNIAQTGPYMHGGQFKSLKEVIEHYSNAPKAPMGDSVLRPLNLNNREKSQLESFLKVLTSPVAAPRSLVTAPEY
jgi:cytochrome c peroxidase